MASSGKTWLTRGSQVAVKTDLKELYRLGLLYVSCVALCSSLAAETVEELLDGGHFKRARAIAETRLKTNPNDAEAAYVMARVKGSYGDYQSAVSFAEKAAALEPKNAQYRSYLGQYYGRYAQRASVFKQLGLARKCKKEVEAALAIDPKNLEALITNMLYMAKAPGIIGGDKTKARKVMEELPSLLGATGYLGQARYYQEENVPPEKLEELYRKAAETDPRNYAAQTNLASEALRSGRERFEAAEKHAREAIQLRPDRVAGYTLLSATYAAQGRITEAEAVLREAEKRVGDDLTPYFNTAQILLRRSEHLDKAEAWLRKYLSQEPEGNAPTHAMAREHLTVALEKLGKRRKT